MVGYIVSGFVTCAVLLQYASVCCLSVRLSVCVSVYLSDVTLMCNGHISWATLNFIIIKVLHGTFYEVNLQCFYAVDWETEWISYIVTCTEYCHNNSKNPRCVCVQLCFNFLQLLHIV